MSTSEHYTTYRYPCPHGTGEYIDEWWIPDHPYNPKPYRQGTSCTCAECERLVAPPAPPESAEERAERIEKLRSKVTKKYVSEEPSADCTGKGLPKYWWKYEGGTFAEDEEVARADGCRPKHTTNNTDYCCPKDPTPLW